MPHTITMLGTGNAFLPHGRMHSLALFDGVHLIDAPPTALIALRQQGISVADLRSVFITHVHGDHVFGFPFLLLERKYISDRSGERPLRVVTTPFGKTRLEQLCDLAFPGSLTDALNHIEWCLIDEGECDDGWRWERFEVHHDDAVEPFGYRFEHPSGASFVHSGDSGPCDTLLNAMQRSDLTVLEMGFPDWVPSTHHHKPKDIAAVAEVVHAPIGVTHTYVDALSAFPPLLERGDWHHPEHVVHLLDGDRWAWSEGRWHHRRSA